MKCAGVFCYNDIGPADRKEHKRRKQMAKTYPLVIVNPNLCAECLARLTANGRSKVVAAAQASANNAYYSDPNQDQI